MNTVKVYINHEDDRLIESLCSWLKTLGYQLQSQEKERHITGLKFEKGQQILDSRA